MFSVSISRFGAGESCLKFESEVCCPYKKQFLFSLSLMGAAYCFADRSMAVFVRAPLKIPPFAIPDLLPQLLVAKIIKK